MSLKRTGTIRINSLTSLKSIFHTAAGSSLAVHGSAEYLVTGLDGDD